ncbi:MAG: FecR family protein [Burkholderiales bacterium]|nr:FecR family protein [Burkholderiales bacterium]
MTSFPLDPTSPARRESAADRLAWIAGALGSAFVTGVFAAPAANVDFVHGDASVSGPGGQTRPLKRGAAVEPGETIVTGDGARAQLKFTDGAYVSLSPGSQFRIDEYRFNGKPDGTEKGFFSLLKGGLRTITGLVGRVNKGAYQVSTSVATIGIRGTEYTIAYGNSVTGSVGGGGITACNAGGCTNVDSGETFYIPSADVRPVITFKTVDLPPPPPPPAPPAEVVAGEARRSDGANDFVPDLPPIGNGPLGPSVGTFELNPSATNYVSFSDPSGGGYGGYGQVTDAFMQVDFNARALTSLQIDLREPNNGGFIYQGRDLSLAFSGTAPIGSEGDWSSSNRIPLTMTYHGSVPPTCSPACPGSATGGLNGFTGANATSATLNFTVDLSNRNGADPGAAINGLTSLTSTTGYGGNPGF